MFLSMELLNDIQILLNIFSLARWLFELKVIKFLQIQNLSPAVMQPQQSFQNTPKFSTIFSTSILFFFFSTTKYHFLSLHRGSSGGLSESCFGFHCKNCTQAVIFFSFLQAFLLRCCTICSSSEPLALIPALRCFESITQRIFLVFFLWRRHLHCRFTQ